jgi:hypothetical protein
VLLQRIQFISHGCIKSRASVTSKKAARRLGGHYPQLPGAGTRYPPPSSRPRPVVWFYRCVLAGHARGRQAAATCLLLCLLLACNLASCSLCSTPGEAGVPDGRCRRRGRQVIRRPWELARS